MLSHDLTLRSAVPGDLDAVGALLEASYGSLLREAYDDAVLRAALPVITTANPALLASGNYYVAETKRGRLAGCGGWSLERPGTADIEPGVGHVRHFGVHPAHARKGVAGALLERCRDAARAAGVTRLECYSTLNGEAFYRKLGFRRLGSLDVELTGGVTLPSVHMVAELQQANA